MYPKYLKRIFDFLFAIILLIVFSPILCITALICFFSFRGKIFFTQARTGKNEKEFTIIKFITMKPVTKNTGAIEDKDRLTRTGKFIRKTSLDELPQLINIIKGEMSFIGPRPLLPEYLPYYHGDEKSRHNVLPGITGLAQVQGRNNLNWDKRLQLDAEYVRNISFRLDLKILFTTIFQIFRGSGINTDPRSAMPDLDQERSNEYISAK